MQAGLICDFIATRWGHEALATMLDAFGRRRSTAEALEEAIGLEPAAFDAAFLEHVNAVHGELVESLDEYRSEVAQLGGRARPRTGSASRRSPAT